MSVVACVTIHECDLCKRLASMKTDAEYRAFEATWYSGFKVSFCPVCREKPEAIDRIAEDERLVLQIRRIVKRTVAEEVTEYAH